MTPKRRAALRKAQLASARKRKGHGRKQNRARTIRRVSAGVAGGVALGGLALGAAFAHSYVKQIKGGPKRVVTPTSKVPGKELDILRVQAQVVTGGGNARARTGLSFANAGRPLRGRTTFVRERDSKGRKRGNYNNPFGSGVFKVGGAGSNLLDQSVHKKIARSKGKYNAERREIYGRQAASLAKKLATKQKRQAAKRQPKSGRKG